MRYIVTLIMLTLLASCFSIAKEVKSSSGQYSYFVFESRDGIVELNVHKNGKFLIKIDTRASIYQKYAIGWYPKKDIIVLDSSDIGTRVWSSENGFTKDINASAYTGFSKSLYRAKYESGT